MRLESRFIRYIVLAMALVSWPPLALAQRALDMDLARSAGHAGDRQLDLPGGCCRVRAQGDGHAAMIGPAMFG